MNADYCAKCGEFPDDIPAVLRRWREQQDALIAADEMPPPNALPMPLSGDEE